MDITPVHLTFCGTEYHGIAIPLTHSCVNGRCIEFDIILNNENKGVLQCTKKQLAYDDSQTAITG
jgi:hypothetical protein